MILGRSRTARFTRFGSWSVSRLVWVVALATVACGKEGPPLPPLHLVPDAVSNVVVRRSGNEVRFSFVLPSKNMNGPGTVDLGRVEIYAATVAGAAAPVANRELMSAKNLVGTIEVRQPLPPGEDPATKPADKRPAPGETTTFVEILDEAKLKPAYTAVDPAAAPVPAQPAAAQVPPVATQPGPNKRVYSIRGAARNGRPGQPAARIEVPLVEIPPPATALKATFSEKAINLAWDAPALAEGTAQFNVYTAEGLTPLNAAPLATAAFERPGVEFGKEECFVVRTVVSAGVVAIESGASERVCVTPADTFAPSPATGLNAVGSDGLISLIWNASSDADLAGYLVLRGEAPGDTLQPLTPAPIKETTFRDTSVKAGTRYVYVVVAVDTAGNRSVPSNRVEEAAR